MRAFLALLPLWTCAQALASSATRAPVLTDRAGPALESAFADPPSAVSLTDAQIHTDHVDLRACDAHGACAIATLRALDPLCTGARTPAFCVRFGPPESPLQPVVLAVLARVSPEVWAVRSAPPPPPPLSPWQNARVWLQLGLWLLLAVLLRIAVHGRWAVLLATGLAVVPVQWLGAHAADTTDPVRATELLGLRAEALTWLAALALGLVAGTAARRWSRWLSLLPLFSLGVTLLSPRVGLWDLFWLASTATLTALWWSDAAPRRALRWGMACALTLFGLFAVEGMLRWRTEVPAKTDDARTYLIALDGTAQSNATQAGWDQALFADLSTTTALRLRPPRGPWVLHLGDSMLFGAGVAAEQAVPSQLQRLLPEWTHVNAGIPASSLDLQYVLLTRVLAAWPQPQAVVLHVFSANDLSELDLPLASCGGAAILRPGLPIAVACAARQERGFFERLSHAPLPLALERAASWSWLARRLVIARHGAAARGRVPELPAIAQRYGDILQAMRGALQTRKIPLVTSFMPVRPGATRDGGLATKLLTTTIQQLDIVRLDSQPDFDALIAQGREKALFLPDNDIHLAPEGASVYAAWLAPQLRQLLPSN